MPTLHVRNISPALHQRIRKLAAAEEVSLSAEVVSLLDGAVRDREMRRRSRGLLSQIRLRRFKLPKGAPSSLELLREDRDR